MDRPDAISSEPVRLSIPELEWEIRGFWVNEGPAVLVRNGRVLITYSGSATDENYCMGILWAVEEADMLDPLSVIIALEPVIETGYGTYIYGPHNYLLPL